MARPVPRRRAAQEAPAADEYTSRRGRKAAEEEPDDEPAEERRPRRGRERGELPSRSRRAAAVEEEPPATSRRSRRAAVEEEEPPATSRRSRRAAPEPDPEPDGPELPRSLRALRALDDAALDELCEHLGLDIESDLEDIWDAVEEAREAQDDEAEEEPPARGRGRSRRASSRDEDDDDEDDDEDEDDAPKRTARKGFAGFKKTREATGGFADDFKLTEDEVLVKFLDDEPFDTYAEHGLYKELNEGQRVWVCSEPDRDCPICATGHKPRAIALFNIVVIPEEGKPELKVLKAGPKLAGILEKKGKLKTGPLTKEYYSCSQTEGKNNGPVEYAIELVRTRDLSDPDGWATKPFTERQLEAFDEKRYGDDFVKVASTAKLKDIARQLRNAD